MLPIVANQLLVERSVFIQVVLLEDAVLQRAFGVGHVISHRLLDTISANHEDMGF